MPKRTDYISWDEYFMWVAMLSAQRSKDPRTQVWACIVSEDKKILGTGYNWFPHNCSDDEFPWEREGWFCDKKYAYVVHAEANAILNATTSLKNATIYVYELPCNECAKLIIQAWIKTVKYLSSKYETENSDFVTASRKMFKAAGIELIKLDFDKDKKLELDFWV